MMCYSGSETVFGISESLFCVTENYYSVRERRGDSLPVMQSLDPYSPL